MKKLVQALFFGICAATLGVAVYFLIRERMGAVAAARPVTTRQVLVSAEPVTPEEREARAERASTVNHISALPNEVILEVATINLDQDEGDEQILTVRKIDRAVTSLSIVVADYLPQRKTWIRSWEGEILVTKLTTLSIQVKDLIGDHNLNIVCTGIDDRDEQTITIFRRSPGSAFLTYDTICSIAADAVTIAELERSEGYQLGQTNGESWPVLANSRDKSSQNILDQIQTRWIWDYRRGLYIQSGIEHIPGAVITREKSAKVLTGSAQDFEAFLQGIWYDTAKGPLDPGSRLIVFDRGGATITFFSSESQEVFHWNDSHPTRYGIYVGSQNESVQNLRRLMDIELSGGDSISVRIFEDLQMKVDAEDRWDGNYRKLPESMKDPFTRPMAGRPGPAFRLDGVYRSAEGTELKFSAPRYILNSKNLNEKGGYAAYKLGQNTVLELRAIRDDGVTVIRRTFRASYSETKSGKETTRRLVLAPARAAITGLELLEEPSMVLLQKTDG
jgi:hypothetical protein